MKIKDMTSAEFKAFVSPSMLAAVAAIDKAGDDAPLIDVIGQVLKLADDQVVHMIVERTLGIETLSPHVMYTSIFLLGMLCEREGWHLEVDVKDQ